MVGAYCSLMFSLNAGSRVFPIRLAGDAHADRLTILPVQSHLVPVVLPALLDAAILGSAEVSCAVFTAVEGHPLVAQAQLKGPGRHLQPWTYPQPDGTPVRGVAQFQDLVGCTAIVEVLTRQSAESLVLGRVLCDHPMK